MSLHDMQREIYGAETVLNNADKLANQAAGLVVGRLKHVSYHRLCQLKKELQNFNMHTGAWK